MTKNVARNIKVNSLKMTSRVGASHIGPILSIADIVAVLYGKVMKINPKNPKDQSRDIFILSKGHAGCALYCALAEVGFFEKKELENYCKYGSQLSGHVSHKVPGVELTTGALGHGLGVGVGFAYSFKIDNKPNQVYTVIGDGECNEGSIWEAVMLAAQLKLDNLHIIVDRNRLQALGKTSEIINMDNLKERFESFGCNVVEIDGHCHTQLEKAFKIIKKEMPTVVVANTIKGKGVSFMENQASWHSRYANPEELEKAINEVENNA